MVLPRGSFPSACARMGGTPWAFHVRLVSPSLARVRPALSAPRRDPRGGTSASKATWQGPKSVDLGDRGPRKCLASFWLPVETNQATLNKRHPPHFHQEECQASQYNQTKPLQPAISGDIASAMANEEVEEEDRKRYLAIVQAPSRFGFP